VKNALARGAAWIALALLAAGSASADPIGPDCDTCQGSIYTLEYDPVPLSVTPFNRTYRITLTIDTSGYSGGGVGIDTVSIKVANFLHAAWLTSAPSGADNWLEFTNQGLNAAGCSSSGGGFSCARVVTDGAIPEVGGTLSWAWNISLGNSTSLLTDPFEASVKARYVDADRQKVGALVSEPITLQPNPAQPIPEPGSAGLAGCGLVALGALSRRARRR
jgi:hypothetical protein